MLALLLCITHNMCSLQDSAHLSNVTAYVAAGLSFMVGTDLDGLFTLRVAIGQSTTQLEHVKRVWAIIQEQATKMLAQQQQ
jgi:hypothetical protein